MLTQFDDLIDMLGAPHVAAMLARFGAELAVYERQYLTAPDAKAHAHRLISQAGMLGFDALSHAARGFESGCYDDQAPPAIDLRREITEVRMRLDTLSRSTIAPLREGSDDTH